MIFKKLQILLLVAFQAAVMRFCGFSCKWNDIKLTFGQFSVDGK